MWSKGGTGKSTVAAALALHLAGKGYRVLAVSTDAAPALGLLLCGRSGVKWEECSGVTVFEVSEEDVKRFWIERFGDEVYEVLSSFLPVGREVVDYVAGAPGIADQYMLYLVYSIAAERSDADIIVWDTAAAGSSLRLLRVEYELYSHLGDAARMYLRIRSALEKLKRREPRRDPLRLIEEWRLLARGILDMLQGPIHRLVLVTSPDRLSAAITRSLLGEFRSHGIEPRALIANMIVNPTVCPICRPWLEEHQEQMEALRELEELGLPVCKVPRLSRRPRAPRELEELASHLAPCTSKILG
ncbi:ArsA family ATPase [Hyperthermus butylicus]|uniref:Oxyanion-translocating ATPase, ArsA n=1 Tax=Hyperthermus butylicus (strain DSM 5456 / JCM 9403 / PLM1-5) TaxID=415426 RepID=A2BJH6_HYPBU|nr:ArsA-related P-loop ATPase [Hyperthermus butylicus]ABM80137.1 Oxyanion-translocating ATPase, ArsA [Hyperthermus butylicus DSM 5456]